MIRFLFDSDQAAAQGLTVVLEHARGSSVDYEFGPLSLKALVDQGLWLVGDTEAVADLLDRLPGVVRQGAPVVASGR